MLKINGISFVKAIKGNISHNAWLNAIYSVSVVLKVISVCNLLHHNTVHLVYVTTYPKRDMTFS